MNKLFEQLAEPFAPEDIEWRVGATNKDKTKGMALPYITARAAMNRYDRVMGPENWRDEYIQIQGGFLGGISLRIDGEWITKWDVGSDSDIEPIKGGVSDAYKRASVKWGMGRYLYDIPIQWVPIEPIGRSYKLSKIPSLPAWALSNVGDEVEEDKDLVTIKDSVADPRISVRYETKFEKDNSTDDNRSIIMALIRGGVEEAMEKRQGRGVTEKARNFAHMLLQQVVPSQDQRHAFCSELFGVERWSDVSGLEVGGFLDWLSAQRHDDPEGGKPTYSIPGETNKLIQRALSR